MKGSSFPINEKFLIKHPRKNMRTSSTKARCRKPEDKVREENTAEESVIKSGLESLMTKIVIKSFLCQRKETV